MSLLAKLGIACSTVFLASGCYPGAQVKAVQLTEPGTYVVATPGALTLAQQSGTAQRMCTLRLPPAHAKGAKHGKRAKHGKADRRGKGGKGGKRGGPAWQGRAMHGPGAGGGAAGGPAMLDTLMFRLCEARSNGDITALQYQELLKGMLDLAKQRAAMPSGPGPFGHPGMRRPMGRPGMGPGMGPGGRGGWGRPPGPEDTDDAPVEKETDDPKKGDGKGKGK